MTAATDAKVRLWDAATRRLIRVVGSHNDPVRSAAFSPDGSRIVTASEDRTARLWEVSPGPMRPQDLVAFAEAIAGRRVDDDAGAVVEVQDRPQRLDRFRAGAVEARSGAPYTFAGLTHWFFVDRTMRTISPRSPMTGQEYQAITQSHAGGPQLLAHGTPTGGLAWNTPRAPRCRCPTQPRSTPSNPVRYSPAQCASS